MPRFITADGFMWIEQRGPRSHVGLTKFGLDQYGLCCTFVPKVKVGDNVKPGMVLASCEGNKCLKPLRSSFEGIVYRADGEALIDEPFKLNERDSLFEIHNIKLDDTVRGGYGV